MRLFFFSMSDAKLLFHLFKRYWPQGPPPRIHILPRPYGNEGDFRKPTSESPRGGSPWLKGNVLRLDSGNVQVYLILSNYTFLV